MEPTHIDILKQQYGFTDEDIRELIAAGVLHGELETVEKDRDYFTRLAEAPTPQGRGWGGVYTAAHPLEHLGTLAQRAAGEYGRYREGQERNRIQEELAELRGLFLRGRAPVAGQPAPATAYPLGTRPGIGTSGWRPYR